MSTEWQRTTESLLAVLDGKKWRIARPIEEELIKEVERLRAELRAMRAARAAGGDCGHQDG